VELFQKERDEMLVWLEGDSIFSKKMGAGENKNLVSE
jgi:hypothetical protein